MLKELRVQNFALINQANIIFKNTFVVITGETGAGKSILLDALSLALGGKTDTSVLFDKTKKSIVEAIFDISQLNLKEFFHTNDLDYQDETIIRREISADGKSRAFINDSPVTITLVKTLGEQLIDIHSQHQNLILYSPTFRYDFVDAIADCLQDRIHYSQLFRQYQKNKKELNDLIQRKSAAQKESEYYHYLFNELKEANIQEGELQQIEEELQQLQNAENIIQQLSSSVNVLKEADINAIQLLTQAKNALHSLTKYNHQYEELLQRLQSIIIETKDIATEAENLLADIEINPEKIQILSDRLDTINKLLKKHQVKTDTELLQIQADLEEKLSQFQNTDELIEQKTKELEQLEEQIIKKAEAISQKRKAVKSKIESTCTEILKDLAIQNAQFIVDIQNKSNNEPDEFGKDEIKFLFSANKGIPPAEVQKTASGGEISRLMLTIKSMMAQKVQMPTIIFDEIDTGLSGTVAGKMGTIMKKMSESMQVIVITHLPQIAAKGIQHFYVSKEEYQNKTISKITELDNNERILEIAKMLSDGHPTQAAIQNAKELLLQ